MTRQQLYVFMKYHSDPNLELYVQNYKRCMLFVVVTTILLLVSLFVFILTFEKASIVSRIGVNVTLYVLFAMQLILVPATIFLYIRLTISFVKAKNLNQSEERPRSLSVMIRESLLGKERAQKQQQMSYFFAIYQKIRIRFHVFFILVIAALMLRFYLYIVIRVP